MSPPALRADLHVHSTASDGTSTPSELVALAFRSGLTHLAITDHDSVEGVAEAQRAAEGTPLVLVPGVELSSVSDDGRDIHLLGYFVDPLEPGLLTFLRQLRSARLHRARAMVASLANAGSSVTIEDVLSFSRDGSVGRSHVARALVASGQATSLRDAFNRLIGRGRPHYVMKNVLSPADAVRAIHDAGGIVVVAHPGILGLDDVVATLATVGLDGVEAYHADHTVEQRLRFAELAQRLDLLTTGGSDYHSSDSPNPALGSIPIPAEALRAFLAAGGAE